MMRQAGVEKLPGSAIRPAIGIAQHGAQENRAVETSQFEGEHRRTAGGAGFGDRQRHDAKLVEKSGLQADEQGMPPTD